MIKMNMSLEEYILAIKYSEGELDDELRKQFVPANSINNDAWNKLYKRKSFQEQTYNMSLEEIIWFVLLVMAEENPTSIVFK